jgi:hypothetical protein
VKSPCPSAFAGERWYTRHRYARTSSVGTGTDAHSAGGCGGGRGSVGAAEGAAAAGGAALGAAFCDRAGSQAAIATRKMSANPTSCRDSNRLGASPGPQETQQRARRSRRPIEDECIGVITTCSITTRWSSTEIGPERTCPQDSLRLLPQFCTSLSESWPPHRP